MLAILGPCRGDKSDHKRPQQTRVDCLTTMGMYERTDAIARAFAERTRTEISRRPAAL
ncbi:hypothetical protein WCQ02_37715 [Paraburkholderia tropica]|uniref:hypothetical protein n=1 Tax=Paraburkholderia tropica TaxID=92647 RepID=UPI0015E8D187|nr:hypothetical protein [Paraburkholderia tropica]